MAKAPKSTPKRTVKKSAPRKTPEQKIIAAALKLAEGNDWAGLKMSQIAAKAKVSLSDLAHLFSSKTDILGAFAAQIDDEVFAKMDPELEEEAARERLLDIMISRFEALASFKDALRRIHKTVVRDPLILAKLNKILVSSMVKMLTAASCETGGLRGLAQAQGLAYVYKSAMDVWLEDDDPGMARTMAELDRRLRRGERMLKRMNMAANLACGAVAVCKSLRKQSRSQPENPSAEPSATT